MARDYYVGGQAVIEGVMMRGVDSWAVAVRAPDGGIEIRDEPYKSFGERHKWASIPLVRGSVALVESMAMGMRALTWSANQSVAGATDEVTSKRAAKRAEKRAEKRGENGTGDELSKAAMATSIALAAVFFIGIFIAGPTLLTRYVIDPFVHRSTVANAIEGLIRLSLFIGYIALISLMPEIRRVFEYHGAEHKTIAAYEYGDRLVPDAVQRYSTRHVRCGTNFMLIVMVLAVAAYAFLGRPPLLWRIASRLVLIPLIAGVSYEVIRLAARHIRNRLVRVLMTPGLWLQALTTRPPSLEQLEVAIASIKAVLPEEEWLEVSERPVLEEAVAIPA